MVASPKSSYTELRVPIFTPSASISSGKDFLSDSILFSELLNAIFFIFLATLP